VSHQQKVFSLSASFSDVSDPPTQLLSAVEFNSMEKRYLSFRKWCMFEWMGTLSFGLFPGH
jgi:hypothetical protein